MTTPNEKSETPISDGAQDDAQNVVNAAIEAMHFRRPPVERTVVPLSFAQDLERNLALKEICRASLETRLDEAKAECLARKLKAQEYCDDINKLLLERDQWRSVARKLADSGAHHESCGFTCCCKWGPALAEFNTLNANTKEK